MYNKILNGVKYTVDVVKGAAIVLASPNEPIPPTKMHPRMPAYPMTIPEHIRMQPWRHMWMYVPAIRLALFSATVTVVLFSVISISSPSQKIQQKKSAEDAHHRHAEIFLHKSQKAMDKIYFKKYDPLRNSRPDAYSMVYGGGH